MNREKVAVTWIDFQNWHTLGRQPETYRFAAHIPKFFDRPQDLPATLLSYDWTQSFGMPQVIYYDERITIATLETLQNFFRARACNIENVVVITSHALGAAEWWQQRSKLYLEKTFKIQEWLLCRTMTWPKWMSKLEILKEDEIKKQKKLRYFFSFYGGTNPKMDRLYITLKVRDLAQFGVIDCLTNVRWTKEQFLNHAMWLTYFQDPSEEQEIMRLYDAYVSNDHIIPSHQFPQLADLPKGNPNIFSYSGYHWRVDSMCLSTVCNETENMQPWAMVSEKTLIPFLHHNLVIPIGYRAVDFLEAQGFWFAHELIDYSYQYEPNWLTRLNLMIQSIKHAQHKIANRYTDFFNDHFVNIRSNALRVYDHYHSTDD